MGGQSWNKEEEKNTKGVVAIRRGQDFRDGGGGGIGVR